MEGYTVHFHETLNKEQKILYGLKRAYCICEYVFVSHHNIECIGNCTTSIRLPLAG